MRTKIEWIWETLDSETKRARVYCGWLILVESKKGSAMQFISDRDHQWQAIKPAVPEKPISSSEIPY